MERQPLPDAHAAFLARLELIRSRPVSPPSPRAPAASYDDGGYPRPHARHDETGPIYDRGMRRGGV